MVAFPGHELRNFLSRSGDYSRVTSHTGWSRALALRVVAPLAFATTATGLAGAPAYAHDALAASNPRDRAVLDRAPAAVTLKFLARLSPQGTKVSVVDPAGRPAMAGPPSFDGPTVSVPMLATVAGIATVVLHRRRDQTSR